MSLSFKVVMERVLEEAGLGEKGILKWKSSISIAHHLTKVAWELLHKGSFISDK